VSYHDLMGRSVHHQYVMKIFNEQQKKANAEALAKAAMEQGKDGSVQLGVQLDAPSPAGAGGAAAAAE
jgi:hypothetical protein